TVVIPAFNEAHRLPAFLRDVAAYFADQSATVEVLTVDDGSRDGLSEALRTFQRAAGGELILVSDADGATPVGEEAALRRTIAEGADIAIGSRMLPRPARLRRPWRRRLAGALFARAVRRTLGLPQSDTQCGFKMLRQPAAQVLCQRIQESGYLFDV